MDSENDVNLEETDEKEEVKSKKEPKQKKEKKNKEVELLKEENALLQDKLLRVSAEMQNTRRRFDEDMRKFYKYEGEDLIKKLLDVVDNFERALAVNNENQSSETEKFMSGMKMIYITLINVLKEKGVYEIECLNKEFDPNFMNAVLVEHIVEEENNIVLEVLQKGYKYNEKVIRPAMVKVNE